MNLFNRINWTTGAGVGLGLVAGAILVYALFVVAPVEGETPVESAAQEEVEVTEEIAPAGESSGSSSKTGYVHLERAMSGYEDFVSAMEEVQEFEEELEAEMRRRGEELEAEMQELQQAAELLGPEEQQRRQQELMQKHQQFQMDVQQMQQRIEEKEAELLEPIHQRVQELVEQVARARGFNRIVRYDIEGSDIVWVEEELDVTEELAEKLADRSNGGAEGQ